MNILRRTPRAAERPIAALAALSALGACLMSLGAAPALAATQGSPLTALFDNTAVTADTDTSAGDLDGDGDTLSASDLDAAGWSRSARITVSGATFSRADVDPGRPDNVLASGQTVAVSGSGSALSFLATAANGPVTGSGTVRYSDGTSSGYRLTVGDWAQGDAAEAALTLPHRNTASGPRTADARLYAVSVPIVRGKAVTSVTLPNVGGVLGSGRPSLHVFGLALRDTTSAPDGKTWEASWAAAMGVASPVPQSGGWTGQTLRMTVHPNLAGDTVRIRLTNALSPSPVTFGHVTLAVQADHGTPKATPVSLTFDGSQQTVVPAGGEVHSDPIAFPISQGDNLLVSVYLPGPVRVAPMHDWALSTSYTTEPGAGDHSADADATGYPGQFQFWTFLTGVDVANDNGGGTVVALGDSQTDGGHTAVDANHRWPDYYAADVRAGSPNTGVANVGLSANSLLTDTAGGAGVSALNRLDRDVFAQPDARTLVLYEGINDIGLHNASATDLISGVRQVAARAHAYGMRVLVATIPPFGGSTHYSDAGENVRQAVNGYLRSSHDVDGCADFDLAARDPLMPSRLRDGLYDRNDNLHFNDTGTKLLADTLARGTPGVATAMSQTAIGDINGDGVADLIAREDSTGSLKAWYGSGDGTFSGPAVVTGGWRDFSETTLADFTGDGLADILAKGPDNVLHLWKGNGDGTFAHPVQVTSGWNFTQTTSADFDGDGKTDLVAKGADNNLYIWPGHGDGTFGSPSRLTSGWNFTQTTSADFNGDGQADLVARSADGILWMWTHNPGGSFNTPVKLTDGWTYTQTVAGRTTKGGKADLLARDDSTGVLKRWPGDGNTGFVRPTDLTAGW
ncbi:FG-GAP-like repeat-containing protein [Kitasatospora sp. NPDC059599]|uniref:FG-GAP-like repeat-containing protein n=1 Tax=Kitasatospora sp. NPDC059599 TaxID=3346880 RepID=UPI0036933414